MKITISDHALVRYIERVQGLSLDPLRREIEAAVVDAATIGASGINIDGYHFVLMRGTEGVRVATALDKHMRPKTKVKQISRADRGRYERAVARKFA